MWTRFVLFALLATSAICQAAGPPPQQQGQPTTRQPYNLETFGTFRSLILTGDFTPKVTLQMIMAKRPTTAVGAVADARGEITIYDGKLIVNYGKEGAHPTSSSSATGGDQAPCPCFRHRF